MINDKKYGYKRKVVLPFTEAVEKTKAELAKEGFGVLTEIDVKATLKKKIGVDFENYLILGACSPASAYEVLKAEKDIGLLLPCNVIVYEENEVVYVSAIVPTVAMSVVQNESLAHIAVEVEERLKKVVNAI